ncbi:MAG: branched-chain amino acid ABC transporter permease [Proteobacteria bacterium]|nr:branched-chain amino acid ABC transporter permease [Pseudomonadota bacterium]
MDFISVLLNGLLTGCVFAQIALPLSIMYGVLKLINFAHGEMIVGGMLVLCFLNNNLGLSPFIALPLTTVIFIFLLIFLNKVLYCKIQASKPTTQFINMIALSIIFLNILLLFFKGDTYSYTLFKGSHLINFLGMDIAYKKLIAAIISVVSTLFLYLFLNKTLIGKSIRAVAIAPYITKTLGLNTPKIFTYALIIISILLSVSCFSLLLTMDVSIQNAPEFTLMCFIIVILGGLGSISGTIISSFIIGINESFMTYYGSSLYKSTVTFLIFIVILLLKPQGLLGEKYKTS